MQTTERITATGIELTRAALTLVLDDRKVTIPWERCSEQLAQATEQQRLAAELSPGGYGIHWPLIDEDLSVSGLMRDSSELGGELAS